MKDLVQSVSPQSVCSEDDSQLTVKLHLCSKQVKPVCYKLELFLCLLKRFYCGSHLELGYLQQNCSIFTINH